MHPESNRKLPTWLVKSSEWGCVYMRKIHDLTLLIHYSKYTTQKEKHHKDTTNIQQSG